MIKKFDKNYVFVKMVYVRFIDTDKRARACDLRFTYSKELQAFDTKQEATEYLKERLGNNYCVGGKLIGYYEALQEFGEDEIILAIEMKLAAEGLKNR